MVANKYAFLQITRRRFLNEWEAFKKVISRRNIRRRITIPLTLRDRKSGSAGMPRPISYAVFCLKKKKLDHDQRKDYDIHIANDRSLSIKLQLLILSSTST